jgi:two-component system sensor histidine kinase KdpD
MSTEANPGLIRLAIRVVLSVTAVAAVTFLAFSVLSVNATTAGFGYLLVVLAIASTWGFVEAFVASIAATLTLNFFFFEPILTLTIQDPKNWVALFSFLVTALVASRLSDKAKKTAQEAMERERDVERLYTFSRAILLIESIRSFPRDLAQKLAETFGLAAVVLYDRRRDEFHRAGPLDFEGMDQQLREAALNGTSFADPGKNRVITAIRLGSEPIASLAIQGPTMPDSVLQGIGNLVAIGLERARAQDLAHQVEASRQTEQLRTALIDAMAHDFKTPLTSILAATTSLLDDPGQPAESREQLVKIADEEARRLRELIDNALEIARLDSAQIQVRAEESNIRDIVGDAVGELRAEIEDRPVDIVYPTPIASVSVDRRLVKVAIKQLLDNALKYSSPGSPVTIQILRVDGGIEVDVTNRGDGIPTPELTRIFERFYRSPSVQHRIPGSGLGLSIAYRIAQAHNGDLTVTSAPGDTTFRMTLPSSLNGARP